MLVCSVAENKRAEFANICEGVWQVYESILWLGSVDAKVLKTQSITAWLWRGCLSESCDVQDLWLCCSQARRRSRELLSSLRRTGPRAASLSHCQLCHPSDDWSQRQTAVLVPLLLRGWLDVKTARSPGPLWTQRVVCVTFQLWVLRANRCYIVLFQLVDKLSTMSALAARFFAYLATERLLPTQKLLNIAACIKHGKCCCTCHIPDIRGVVTDHSGHLTWPSRCENGMSPGVCTIQQVNHRPHSWQECWHPMSPTQVLDDSDITLLISACHMYGCTLLAYT